MKLIVKHLNILEFKLSSEETELNKSSKQWIQKEYIETKNQHKRKNMNLIQIFNYHNEFIQDKNIRKFDNGNKHSTRYIYKSKKRNKPCNLINFI